MGDNAWNPGSIISKTTGILSLFSALIYTWVSLPFKHCLSSFVSFMDWGVAQSCYLIAFCSEFPLQSNEWSGRIAGQSEKPLTVLKSD